MSSWFTEGTAHRTTVQRTPIVHVLVELGGDWVMWCSGSKGREDNPHGDRLCRKCRDLMRDAFDQGDVEAQEARRWLTEEQMSSAKAREES